MSNEFDDSLHKILKDKIRRKIILLLTEKSSLSYTNLLDSLEGVNNGRLNYHLKVLGDLLLKDADGQYLLSERGRLASKLLLESAGQQSALQYRGKAWKRLLAVLGVSNLASILLLMSLTFLGYIDFIGLIRGIFGFATTTVGLYFFYRMIRPPTVEQVQSGQVRTVQDIFVSGRHLQEVHEEIQRWANEEGLTVEVERDGFLRGHLGTPSGLITTPKYFEVTYKPDQSGVLVHTEGWIGIFGVSERSFSKTAFAFSGPARKSGWKIMSRLWQRLKALSK